MHIFKKEEDNETCSKFEIIKRKNLIIKHYVWDLKIKFRNFWSFAIIFDQIYEDVYSLPCYFFDFMKETCLGMETLNFKNFHKKIFSKI